MYALVKSLGMRSLVTREAVYLGMALVIAEVFYKFHSFTLEAMAFLVTWYCLSRLGNTLLGNSRRD